MFGGVIQRGEVLINVFIVFGNILVLYIYRTYVPIQGFQVFTYVRRLAKVSYGTATGMKLRDTDFGAGIGFLYIRRKIDIQPDIGLGARDVIHPRLLAVHYKGIVRVSGSQFDCFGCAVQRIQNQLLGYFYQPCRVVAGYYRCNLCTVTIEYLSSLPIKTDEAGIA